MPVLDETLLTVHNFQTLESSQCTLNENRFIDQKSGYFCWRGIVFQQPECIMAEACDPTSFIGARDRFCLTFGGNKDPRNPGDSTCVPDKFVPNLNPKDPVVNPRGGTVTYDPQAECKGLNGWLHCAGKGLQQSLANPNKTAMLEHVMLFVIVAGTIAIMVRYNRPWIKKHFHVKGPILNLKSLKSVKESR